MFNLIGRHATSGVGKSNTKSLVGILFQRRPQCSALRHRLQSIAREVPEHLLQLAFVSFSVKRLIRQLLDNALVRTDLRTVSHEGKRLVQQVSNVHTRLNERAWPCVTK